MKKNTHVTFRCPTDLYNRIKRDFLTENYNWTDFIVDSLIARCQDAVSESDILINAANLLIEKSEKQERDINILFHMFDFFVKHFFVYNAEIPADMRDAAALSAHARHENFKKNFTKHVRAQKKTFIYDLFNAMIEDIE